MSVLADMPFNRDILGDLGRAFGRDDIVAQVRSAVVDGRPTFYARENGHEIGVKAPEGNGVTAGQMALGSNTEIKQQLAKDPANADRTRRN